MALITRMARMMRADLNAVLDRIEEPELLLRQAVRDMEEEISAAEQQLAQRQAERDRHTHRIDGLDQALSRIEDELDLCFESDKPDLARSLVRRKLETQRLRGELTSRVAETSQAIEQARARLEQDRVRLESMRQKAELFEEPASGHAAPGGDSGGVSDEEVEVAYLRELKQRGSK